MTVMIQSDECTWGSRKNINFSSTNWQFLNPPPTPQIPQNWRPNQSPRPTHQQHPVFLLKNPGKAPVRWSLTTAYINGSNKTAFFSAWIRSSEATGGRVFLLTPVPPCYTAMFYSKLGHTITTQKSSGHEKLTFSFKWCIKFVANTGV